MLPSMASSGAKEPFWPIVVVTTQFLSGGSAGGGAKNGTPSALKAQAPYCVTVAP